MQVPIVTEPDDILSSGYPIIPSIRADVPIDSAVLDSQLTIGKRPFQLKTKCVVNPLDIPPLSVDLL